MKILAFALLLIVFGAKCQPTEGTITGTHFWDCSGAACDSKTLQPWNSNVYRYTAQYAPLDPNDYGGSTYGEKIWMTGAASDDLSAIMGQCTGVDDGCCGTDGSRGGCGKCLLVENPEAVNAHWKVIVMKKNRCPPESSSCGNGQLNMDFAAPGYDNLQFSTANICGQSNTYLSASQSSACGSWYSHESSTNLYCNCSFIPNSTPEEQMLRKGCQLFTAWGWKSGSPQNLKYKVVQCPTSYRNIISNAFGASGSTHVTDQNTVHPSAGTDQSSSSFQSWITSCVNSDDSGTDNSGTDDSGADDSGSSGYCNYNNCQDSTSSESTWCNENQVNCENFCNGKYCGSTSDGSDASSSEETGYCNPYNCLNDQKGSDWCNLSKQNCEGSCSGTFCSGVVTFDWYCNWSGCNGVAEGGLWCNSSKARCASCTGEVCSK